MLARLKKASEVWNRPQAEPLLEESPVMKEKEGCGFISETNWTDHGYLPNKFERQRKLFDEHSERRVDARGKEAQQVINTLLSISKERYVPPYVPLPREITDSQLRSLNDLP